jgi:ABC-type microcin C transport system permease subunit YejB
MATRKRTGDKKLSTKYFEVFLFKRHIFFGESYFDAENVTSLIFSPW